MVFNDPGPGVLPRCNFISSGVDHIDFGIAAQYNLIPSFIKHLDIPLPWRGCPCALHTDGVVISCPYTVVLSGSVRFLYFERGSVNRDFGSSAAD